MISLCVKTNNKNIINYLMTNISTIDLNDIIFTQKDFSKYKNIIIHFLGTNTPEFYNEISTVLMNCIIDNYEDSIIHKLLLLDYFYFDDVDIFTIRDNCKDLINTLNTGIISIKNTIADRKVFLYNAILHYITCNKSIVLDGFITFRISNYIHCLNEIVDYVVSQFVINREYSEFIDMLKIYISSKTPGIDLVHLIYINEESVLLDKNKKVLALSKNNLDTCFLSDITFSSNDYALNSLLSLLPSRLIVHLISPADDFINTLKSIFGDAVTICTNCDMCKMYKALNKIQG